MTVTLYGFKSCDMVRKARAWLADNRVEHRFFDYRVESLGVETVDDWFGRAGWEQVFNRNSTTFKNLPEEDRQNVDEKRARAMLLAETNLIKRPILDTGSDLVFGFKPDSYAQALRG